MLRTNLSASSPNFTDKTLSNQADPIHSVSPPISLSPRNVGKPVTPRTITSGQSGAPQMHSRSIPNRAVFPDAMATPDGSGTDPVLSGSLSSPFNQSGIAEKGKSLLSTLNLSLRTLEKSADSKSGHSSPAVSPRSPRSSAWSSQSGALASPRSPRKSEADPIRHDRHRVLSNSPRSPRVSAAVQSPQKTTDTIESPSRNTIHRMSAPPVLIRMPLAGLNAARQSELAKLLAVAWLDTAKADAGKPKKSLHQKSSTDSAPSPRTSGTPILSDSICTAFARSEVKIPKRVLPADLLALLPPDAQEHVSHTALIKLLFTPKLKEGAAGKTILAMKTAVMQQHSADDLMIGQPETEERKKSAMAAMKPHADAIIEVCFGLGAKGLASSQLPKELIEFWKEADAALVAWALDNPDLSAEKIAGVRSNLGIDIILTRQIYPMLFGQANEAHLAVPGWFGTVVREAAIKAWPVFFDDFAKAANLALAAPLQAALAERATPKVNAVGPVQTSLSEKPEKSDQAD